MKHTNELRRYKAPFYWIVRRDTASDSDEKTAQDIMREKDISWWDLYFLLKAYVFDKDIGIKRPSLSTVSLVVSVLLFEAALVSFVWSLLN